MIYEEVNEIKGILMDYGGTIDTNGIHWAEVIYEAYKHNDMQIDKNVFRDAYIYGERSLEKYADEIKEDDTFMNIMLRKVQYQFDYLHNGKYIKSNEQYKFEDIAKDCYDFAARTIKEIMPTLIHLSRNYPLVLVSNFYGNLRTVLQDFKIEYLFTEIIESAKVGVRKPNPKIFDLGIASLGLNPNDILVVGDSYKNDIEPAKKLGCSAAWLKNIGWDDDENVVSDQADFIINNFSDIQYLEILQYIDIN